MPLGLLRRLRHHPSRARHTRRALPAVSITGTDPVLVTFALGPNVDAIYTVWFSVDGAAEASVAAAVTAGQTAAEAASQFATAVALDAALSASATGAVVSVSAAVGADITSLRITARDENTYG